ncbi:MAG: hypothetical protein ACRD12_07380, partial [Acidimicrobiales bacterium]
MSRGPALCAACVAERNDWAEATGPTPASAASAAVISTAEIPRPSEVQPEHRQPARFLPEAQVQVETVRVAVVELGVD